MRWGCAAVGTGSAQLWAMGSEHCLEKQPGELLAPCIAAWRPFAVALGCAVVSGRCRVFGQGLQRVGLGGAGWRRSGFNE